MNVSGAVSIGDIFASLTLEDSFSGRLQIAATQLENIGKTWNKVGAQLGSVANAMLPLSLAVTGAGAAAVMASGQFESTLTKISTLAGVSSQDLAKVKSHILDLGPAVGQGPQALADAMMVVSSTVEDTSTALSILDVAAKASASGLGESKEVARALTSIINSYGAANITAARAGDILTATVKAGGAEANEMAGTLGRVIPIAAQAGVKFEEVGAFMATFTKLGVDASEAVTALRGVLTTLLSPTKDAEKALMDVGSSTDALRKQVRDNGLTDAMVKLLESFKGNETAAAAVFGNVRALAGVMGTAGQQAATYRSVLDQVTNSTGLMDKAFARIKGTQVQTWNELTSTVGVLAIKFGDALAPSFLSALQAAQPLLDAAVKMAAAFATLPQPVQTLAIGFGLVVAAAAPMLFMFSSFAKVIGSVATGVGTLTGFFVAETAAIASDTAAVVANTAAKTAMVGATQAAGAATVAFAAEQQTAFLFTGNVVETLEDMTPALWKAEQALLPLSGAMTATAVAAGPAAVETAAVGASFAAWPVALGAAAAALVLGVDGLKSLGSIAQSTGSIIVSFAKDAFSTLKFAAVEAGGAIKDFGKWLADTVPGVGLFGEAVGGLRGKLHEVAGAFKEMADEAGKGNWFGIAAAIKPAFPMLAGFMEAMSGVGAAAANAKAQVMQYQTAEQAAAAAAEHDGWVMEQNALKLKKLGEEMAKHASAKAAITAAEKEAMDKLNNRDAVDTAILYAGALDKVDTVGKMTRDSQVKLAESMEEAIKIYTAAGKAIPADMVRIAAEARNLSGTVTASTQALLDMATATDRLRLQQSGTKMQQGLFDVDQWEKDAIRAAKDAGTFNDAMLAQIKDHSKAMRDSVTMDFDAVRQGAGMAQKEAVDAVTVAQNTLSELVSRGASALDINAARDRLDAARDNMAKFQMTTNSALDQVQKKAEEVHDSIERITQPIVTQLEQLSKAQFDALGGVNAMRGIEQGYISNPGRKEGGTGSTGLNSNDWQGYRAMLEERIKYAQLKAYFEKYMAATENAPPPNTSTWNQMTGTNTAPAGSSSATTGMSMNRGIATAGGTNMQNTFYVNGTAEESAEKIGAILMRKARTSRQFPSLG